MLCASVCCVICIVSFLDLVRRVLLCIGIHVGEVHSSQYFGENPNVSCVAEGHYCNDAHPFVGGKSKTDNKAQALRRTSATRGSECVPNLNRFIVYFKHWSGRLLPQLQVSCTGTASRV